MPNRQITIITRIAPLFALTALLFLISACEPLLLTPMPGEAGAGAIATVAPDEEMTDEETAVDSGDVMTEAITLPAVVSKVLLPTPTPVAAEEADEAEADAEAESDAETESEADVTAATDATAAMTETTSITTVVDVVAVTPLTASMAMTATAAPTVTADLTVTDELTMTSALTATGGLTTTDEVTATGDLTATMTPTATVDISATDDVTTAVSPVRYGVVNADRLNVRSAPSTEGDVIAKVFVGDRMVLLAENETGDWLSIDLDDVELLVDTGDSTVEEGWVAAEFVDEEVSTEEPVAESEADPESDAEAIDEAEVEAEIDGDEEAADEETAEETPRPEPDVPTAYTQPDRMNVRGGPGTNYAVITNVPAGSALEILASNAGGDWYQVRLPDQEEPGWVYAPLTDSAGPMDSVQPLPEDQLPEPPPEPEVAAPVAAAAVSAPAPAGGGFFGYGVQAHMLGGGIDPALDATAGMGFNWIKQQVEWRHFEGSQGAIDFSELRRITDAAGPRGVNVLFSVVNAPEWAREPGFDGGVGGPPADPGTYAAFVGRLAGEFCGSQLKAIEVWNEQNLHYEWGNKPLNPADYMNLLRPAYASIKAACPSMLVISGALTPAGDAGPYARDDFAYLEGMYQNGLAGYADGIGAHPSGYNVPPSVGWQDACAVIQQTGNSFNGPCDTPHHSWSFRSTIEGYRNIMNVYGDSYKRLWPTEFGWAVGPAVSGSYAYANDNSIEEQAAWTVEAYQMMRNWGFVGPAFLWNLNFRVVADGSEKAQWGIVRNDYGPLPTYHALQGMGK